MVSRVLKSKLSCHNNSRHDIFSSLICSFDTSLVSNFYDILRFTIKVIGTRRVLEGG